VANYLQRVIASGALTGVAEKPPVSVAPMVPLARAPLVPPDLGPIVNESVPRGRSARELAHPGHLGAEVKPKPDAGAGPRLESAPAEVGDSPIVADALAQRSEKPIVPVPAPAASLRRATFLPGVTPGPRIQAPKGLRQLTGQSRTGAGQVETQPPSPLVVEHTPSPVREAPTVEAPAASSAAQPDDVGTMRALPSAAVPPNPTPPPTPDAPREPVRAAVPTAVPTATQPQPPREAPVGPIAIVSRRQSRITIGRVDVQVNNRPAVAPPRSQPPRAGAGVAPPGLLEAIGLDRFAIKP